MTKEINLLVKMRQKAGLTQAAVTKKLGLTSPQYLSNIERGRCLLSPKQMKKVAKIYKVRPVLLVEHWLSVKRAQLMEQVK